MNNESTSPTAGENSDRALLDVSSMLATQSEVHAILHSASLLLSKIIGASS
jgi:hypothetical protein